MTHKISVIGSVSAAVQGRPYGQVRRGMQNPGRLSLRIGGSGRNLALNFARLGAETALVARVGDDFPGHAAIDELAAAGIDTSGIAVDSEKDTPASLEIRNIVDELEMAFGNEDLLDEFRADLPEDVRTRLRNADGVCFDACMPGDRLEQLTALLDGIPLALDPVSPEHAEKARPFIGRFQLITPNREEAERLTGMDIFSPEQMEEAARRLAERGVARVFITIAGAGVFYYENGRSGIVPAYQPAALNEHGAGAAFTAAALLATLDGLDIEETAARGLAAAAITLESRKEVSDELSAAAVERRIAEAAEAAAQAEETKE
ncbi:MAG: carbohydrate kinase family protein [Anaerovoracaceae bacterium]|jgi:pseudouridine kinase